MFCTKDQRDVAFCTCLDMAERLGKLSSAGGNFAARWCARCDQHYSQCRCDEPVWAVRQDGEIRVLPTEGQDQFQANGPMPVFPTEVQPVFDKTREICGMTKVTTKSGSEYVFRSEGGRTYLTKYSPAESSRVPQEWGDGSAVTFSEFPVEEGYPLALRFEDGRTIHSTVITEVDLGYNEEE